MSYTKQVSQSVYMFAAMVSGLICALVLLHATPVQAALTTESWTSGTLIRLENSTSIYYKDAQNVRHVYPEASVYAAYFGTDTSKVQVISALEMSLYPLGANVPYPAGVVLKLVSDPKFYVVKENAMIHAVSATVLEKIYGTQWQSLVKTLPEGLFPGYTVGTPLVE